MSVPKLSAEIFQRVPCQLGEGPVWHAARGTVWWVDINAQKLLECAPSGGPVRETLLPQLIGAVAPSADGRLVAALHQGIYSVDPDSGAIDRLAEAPDHDPRQLRFNDGKIDPQGRFWAGTLALDGRARQARLYRVGQDRSVTTMLTEVSLSNGLDWSPDGKMFYYIDTPTCRVQVFDFQGETGQLGAGRTAFSLDRDDGWPDGCCVDAEGCLWLAHWGAGKVSRWDPRRGQRLAEIRLPVRNVTSCAFVGPELDRLIITTAQDTASTASEPEAGFVFTVTPGVTGVARPPFGAVGTTG